MRGAPFVYVYIDDLLVASATSEEHRQHFCALFSRLGAFELVLNIKCIFGTLTIEFLGHTIIPDGIQFSLSRVQAICDFPRTVHGTSELPSQIHSMLRSASPASNRYAVYYQGPPHQLSEQQSQLPPLHPQRTLLQMSPFRVIHSRKLPLGSWLMLQMYLLEQLFSSKFRTSGPLSIIHFSLRSSIQQKLRKGAVRYTCWHEALLLFPGRSHISHPNGS